MQLGHHARLRDNLPELEKAILWTMRAWVLGHCRRRPVDERIQTVFDYLNASEAAFHLGRFMLALSHGALRSIEVNCVCNEVVSADEATLLEIFSFQQREQHEDAFERMSALVTEFAAIAGCDHANRTAIVLAEANQMFSSTPRPGPAKHPWSGLSATPTSHALH
jgi:hypothetical protein